MTTAARALRERAGKLKRRYGITPAQWQMMWDRQHGLCDICAKPLKERAHVDHDPKSGRVRGLLHGFCNKMLNRRYTAAMFARAARYLESPFDGRDL
jgi:hypothetical protein